MTFPAPILINPVGIKFALERWWDPNCQIAFKELMRHYVKDRKAIQFKDFSQVGDIISVNGEIIAEIVDAPKTVFPISISISEARTHCPNFRMFYTMFESRAIMEAPGVEFATFIKNNVNNPKLDDYIVSVFIQVYNGLLFARKYGLYMDGPQDITIKEIEDSKISFFESSKAIDTKILVQFSTLYGWKIESVKLPINTTYADFIDQLVTVINGSMIKVDLPKTLSLIMSIRELRAMNYGEDWKPFLQILESRNDVITSSNLMECSATRKCWKPAKIYALMTGVASLMIDRLQGIKNSLEIVNAVIPKEFNKYRNLLRQMVINEVHNDSLVNLYMKDIPEEKMISLPVDLISKIRESVEKLRVSLFEGILEGEYNPSNPKWFQYNLRYNMAAFSHDYPSEVEIDVVLDFPTLPATPIGNLMYEIHGFQTNSGSIITMENGKYSYYSSYDREVYSNLSIDDLIDIGESPYQLMNVDAFEITDISESSAAVDTLYGEFEAPFSSLLVDSERTKKAAYNAIVLLSTILTKL